MVKLLAIFNSKVFKNIGLYSLLNLINSAIPFLLLPILTNKLSKEEYGTIDLFNNTSFILMPIVGLNVGAAVIRFFYDQDVNKKDLLSTAINFTVITSLCFILLFSLFISFIDIEEVFSAVFLLALVYACFSQVSEILLSYYRAIENPKAFGIFRICKTILDFGITISILLYVYVGWEARVYSAVGVAFVFAFIALIILLKKTLYSLTINVKLLKEIIIYSSPLIIHSISGYLISYSDRFIILHHYDLSYVGLYSVAYQIGLIMSFVSNSVNQAWTPFLFSKLSMNDQTFFKRIKRINYMYSAFLIGLALFLYLLVPYMYKYLIGKDFLIDTKIVLFVLLGYAFNGMYKMVVNYMFYYKKTMLLSFFTFVSAVFNVILTYFLVLYFGLIGAALSSLASFILLYLLVNNQFNILFKKNVSYGNRT